MEIYNEDVFIKHQPKIYTEIKTRIDLTKYYFSQYNEFDINNKKHFDLIYVKNNDEDVSIFMEGEILIGSFIVTEFSEERD